MSEKIAVSIVRGVDVDRTVVELQKRKKDTGLKLAATLFDVSR